MATQILRTVDRWRFEAPLAFALAAAAGFAAMAMPHEIFARVPVVGDLGRPGHVALAVAAALVCGALGYVAMRRAARPVPVTDDDDDIEDLYAPVAAAPVAPVIDMPDDGPVRLRRADRHPDAPPRAPIRASRDLGEPFMDVASPVATIAKTVVAEPAIEPPVVAVPEAVEQAEPAPIEPEAVESEGVEPEAVEPAPEAVVATPAEPHPVAAAPRDEASLAAMMERLSAGMQRRGEAAGKVVAPARDKAPALRDALDELNRLAERRG